MQIGVNYPWFDYGWDFGVGPAGWCGGRTVPGWRGEIDSHLRRFQDLGIGVVRWFIVADGLTYGVGQEAPVPDPAPDRGWRFDPPPLGPEFLEHFNELLARFERAQTNGRPQIQLLPVLIDFRFCEPGILLGEAGPRWVKQGRADAILEAAKRQRFLDYALDPLLRISRKRPDTIYAWEIINEPDWITSGWHPSRFARTRIPETAMRSFIEEGEQRIRMAGFKPTIGFASIETLRKSGITAELNQFHHYPNGSRALDRHSFAPEFPGIIGELATGGQDIWPELTTLEQTTLHRLRRAREQGYSLAIPWSFLANDRHTSWSPAVERDIDAFTREAHRPMEVQGA